MEGEWTASGSAASFRRTEGPGQLIRCGLGWSWCTTRSNASNSSCSRSINSIILSESSEFTTMMLPRAILSYNSSWGKTEAVFQQPDQKLKLL